jgi:hypothetical protein
METISMLIDRNIPSTSNVNEILFPSTCNAKEVNKAHIPPTFNVSEKHIASTSNVNESTSNIIDMTTPQKTPTKRKNPNIDIDLSTSEDEISSIQDHTTENTNKVSVSKAPLPKRITPDTQNNVHTIGEAYHLFRSFTHISKLPKCNEVPDRGEEIDLISTSSLTEEDNPFKKIDTISCPLHSLITFHNTHKELPKSHATVKIHPGDITRNRIDIIPKECDFIYELLLNEDSIKRFKTKIPLFIAWAEKRQSPYIITVPQIHGMELQNAVPNVFFKCVPRPFIHKASPSSTR